MENKTNNKINKVSLAMLVVGTIFLISTFIMLTTYQNLKNNETNNNVKTVNETNNVSTQQTQVKSNFEIIRKKQELTSEMYGICEDFFEVSGKIANQEIKPNEGLSEYYELKGKNTAISKLLDELKVDETDQSYEDVYKLKYINSSISKAISDVIDGIDNVDDELIRSSLFEMKANEDDLDKIIKSTNF